MTGMGTDSLARMKELYSAFARGDMATVFAAMDDHTEWYETEGNPWFTGRPFVGVEEITNGVFRWLATEFEQFEIVPTRFLSDGPTVVVEGRYRARRYIPTGKQLDAEVVHIWDLLDARVARFHQYVDTRNFAEVVGVEG